MHQFVPPSYGQLQNNINSSSQFQPNSQMHPNVTPVAAQPWLTSTNQTLSLVPPMQQAGQQTQVTYSADQASFV